MELTYTTIAETGAVHHIATRGGQRFGVLTGGAGRRTLLVYQPSVREPSDPDTPVVSITLEPDEADHVAEILHSRPVLDRLAAIERHLLQLDKRR